MHVIIDGVTYAPVPDPVTDKTVAAALDVRFDSDAGDNLTVRDYLRTLLEKLWREGEASSAKGATSTAGLERGCSHGEKR